MIAIIDYKAGNLASVSNAMERLQAEYRITSNKDVLDEADAVIFPGVGHAGSAMKDLQKNGLDSWLQEARKPVLGICLGMQLFYDETGEGATRALGIIPGKLEKFNSELDKVPHMGWNTVILRNPHPLMHNIAPDTHFYHVHSYYAPVTDHTIAVSHYSTAFTAVAARNNFLGVQFHPEKSGQPGEQLLRNFLDIVYGKNTA